MSAIFISGVMATPGDVYIIAIEKVIPENIGVAVGNFFSIFAHIYLKKVTKALVTILSGFKYPPIAT